MEQSTPMALPPNMKYPTRPRPTVALGPAVSAALLLLVVLLGACRGGQSAVDLVTDPTPTPEATAPASTEEAPATAVPPATVPPAPTASSAPTATPAPSSTPALTASSTSVISGQPGPDIAKVASFSTTGFNQDAGFGWFGTGYPPTVADPCDLAPREQLVTFTLGDADEAVWRNAGLERSHALSEMVFGPEGDAAALMFCADEWVVEVLSFDSSGTYAGTSVRLALEENSWYWQLAWETDDRLTLTGSGPPYAGGDGWNVLNTTVDLTNRAVTSEVEFRPYTDLDAASTPLTPLAAAPDGSFHWFTGPDPQGRSGCEGTGIATAIFVSSTDSADDAVLALSDGDVYAYVDHMEFGEDDIAVWTSQCEGFTSYNAGRIGPEGNIVDPHWLSFRALHETQPDSYVEVRSGQLLDDGRFLTLAIAPDTEGHGIPVFGLHDLSDSPEWINTREVPLEVDPTPLAPATDGVSTWHLGETTSPEAACGAQTIYRSSPDGWSRILLPDQELDTVVALNVGFDDRPDSEMLAVVASTVCPEEYTGRRIVGALQTDSNARYMWFDFVPVDNPELEVAEVILVTIQRESGGWPAWIEATVLLPDGSLDTVELRLPPYE